MGDDDCGAHLSASGDKVIDLSNRVRRDNSLLLLDVISRHFSIFH